MSTANTDDQVRVIDTGAPPARYARGWHCLGLADSFRDGKPHTITAFGTELVVFAGADGKLNVLDAYCRHMGGNLGDGTIKGDTIACPFHDWRWKGNGRCAAIPYARRVPPLARTKAWTTLEQNRQLFVWHDPEGNPPPEDITIPRIEGAFSDEWSDWTWNQIVIDGANCREVIDNVVDMAHFFYVHFAFPTYFKNVFEGHIASQYMTSIGREDMQGELAKEAGGKNVLHSEAHYYGPSYMIDNLVNESNGQRVEAVLINCHYPVTPTKFVLQYGAIVKKLPGLPPEEADAMAVRFAGGLGRGFEQDVAIWKRKTRIDNPLLCEEDGPVYQLRRWYEQFYRDVAEVDEKMTDRFEFEVDTARAITAWEAEVAENLAAQRASSGA
ncbi:3-ketosteroid 9alpha-monooxygenase subunit A [Nocardia amikacinitolerans]|uniref:Rieske-type oxygenase n=1 Tax=Nocardia amikacinitolerans TaxID=756689 RepID=A0A285KRW1_9NOCA|nr:Rieske 2Fe-2S domain-containing protein [Nocardia amikacinitolerans]MCP2275655.1 3-ketosteroid 9alpha-monooxygenase subunit A [Nocardia amikacinitolerans]SNY75394.1 3-ketosteroid 9alpha-monooxygenase subunit A [Nocardia amikacinitolerans]